jgi:hypothetical protein
MKQKFIKICLSVWKTWDRWYRCHICHIGSSDESVNHKSNFFLNWRDLFQFMILWVLTCFLCEVFFVFTQNAFLHTSLIEKLLWRIPTNETKVYINIKEHLICGFIKIYVIHNWVDILDEKFVCLSGRGSDWTDDIDGTDAIYRWNRWYRCHILNQKSNFWVIYNLKKSLSLKN